MKKSMFTICFLFIAIFAFANTFDFNKNETMPTEPNLALSSSLSTEVGTADYFSCSVLHVIIVNDERVGEYYSSAPDGNPNCGGIVYHVFKHAPDA